MWRATARQQRRRRRFSRRRGPTGRLRASRSQHWRRSCLSALGLALISGLVRRQPCRTSYEEPSNLSRAGHRPCRNAAKPRIGASRRGVGDLGRNCVVGPALQHPGQNRESLCAAPSRTNKRSTLNPHTWFDDRGEKAWSRWRHRHRGETRPQPATSTTLDNRASPPLHNGPIWLALVVHRQPQHRRFKDRMNDVADWFRARRLE